MHTFADWLRYYNNLDVAPDLEALKKMKASYSEKGIDILKDAVSIPGVSLLYLLRGAVERGAEMCSPCKEAYEMLKGAIVGGPSIVFSRYNETRSLPGFCGAGDRCPPHRGCGKSKELLAEVFKPLGNSGYGKLIEALERQMNVIYTKDEKVVDRALRSAYFSNLEEIGQAYELESSKPRITINRPFQVGIAVYQLAKLRMLEFYYDFLYNYLDPRDFELIQMDTDSNFMAISAERLDDIVR
ncbi:hypothetical protein ACROYT_G040490 [Oculina patagonica]